ncbi:MAG: SulP family inorganic anion transporter [Anaerolineales bacterium]
MHLADYLPVLAWARHYKREDLSGDLIAGVIVAIMLVPQSMAYALLAGLPPQVGLYASIAPPIVYGLLGTSRVLAVGPVAIDSLLVVAGLSQFAAESSAEYLLLALTLAFMVGVIQLFMGFIKAGSLVNFLSYPVLSGFTNAAALVIIVSQIKHVLGIQIPRSESVITAAADTLAQVGQVNPYTLGIGLGSIVTLLFFQHDVPNFLKRVNAPAALITPLSKAGPLVIVFAGTLMVWGLGLQNNSDVAIVGEVPPGLPGFSTPSLDPADIQKLFPIAVTISLVGFMESISIGKSLASKRRQKLDPNQELIALGTANIAAALTSGYSVTGGLSRSVVNDSAGARTGLASLITATLIALTLLFFTGLFYYLPNAVLAAIILVATAKLIDGSVLRRAWRYNKADAWSLIITFWAVLLIGIQNGIFLGIFAALALFLWRTSRPHVAVVGRVGDSEHFRNVERYETQTCPHVLAVRVDESLYFANFQYLESCLLNMIADQPEVEHLVLVCSGVNTIDTSALEGLETFISELRSAGVVFYMSNVKGPVMDRLRAVGFVAKLGEERVFLTIHQAMQHLNCPRN